MMFLGILSSLAKHQQLRTEQELRVIRLRQKAEADQLAWATERATEAAWRAANQQPMNVSDIPPEFKASLRVYIEEMAREGFGMRRVRLP